MESIREVTERGSGHWGYRPYDVELATLTTTWTDSAGGCSRTLVSYELLIPPGKSGTGPSALTKTAKRSSGGHSQTWLFAA